VFDGKSEEEQGWGSNWDGIQGEFSAGYWDIPSSHKDWANPDTLDNADGCVCGWNDNPNEWYSDCPGRNEAVKEFNNKLEGAE
jgi:hypothetical protein